MIISKRSIYILAAMLVVLAAAALVFQVYKSSSVSEDIRQEQSHEDDKKAIIDDKQNVTGTETIGVMQKSFIDSLQSLCSNMAVMAIGASLIAALIGYYSN